MTNITNLEEFTKSAENLCKKSWDDDERDEFLTSCVSSANTVAKGKSNAKATIKKCYEKDFSGFKIEVFAKDSKEGIKVYLKGSTPVKVVSIKARKAVSEKT